MRFLSLALETLHMALSLRTFKAELTLIYVANEAARRDTSNLRVLSRVSSKGLWVAVHRSRNVNEVTIAPTVRTAHHPIQGELISKVLLHEADMCSVLAVGNLKANRNGQTNAHLGGLERTSLGGFSWYSAQASGLALCWRRRRYLKRSSHIRGAAVLRRSSFCCCSIKSERGAKDRWE